MFGIRGFLMKDELYKSFVEELYNRLDKDRYPTTIETLCYIVDMAIMILIKSMAMYYQNPSEKWNHHPGINRRNDDPGKRNVYPDFTAVINEMRRLSNEKLSQKKSHGYPLYLQHPFCQQPFHLQLWQPRTARMIIPISQKTFRQ